MVTRCPTYARLVELADALKRPPGIDEKDWDTRLMPAEQSQLIAELEDQLRAKNKKRREDARYACMQKETATKPDWGTW